MWEGIFVQKNVPVEDIMPYAPYPIYSSGLKESDNSIYRYAKNLSDFPNLVIVEPIYDEAGNVIQPGYYGLVLSDDREFLVLIQGDLIFAVIPVFRLQEDKQALAQERDKKYIRQKAKKDKERAKRNVKLAKSGIPPEVDEVYMDATIEYQPNGDYYLIKYERDKIRAWGAIKK